MDVASVASAHIIASLRSSKTLPAERILLGRRPEARKSVNVRADLVRGSAHPFAKAEATETNRPARATRQRDT